MKSNLLIFLQEEVADSTKPINELDVEDLYTKYKVSGIITSTQKQALTHCSLQKLQKQLEFLEVQEEYIKDEQRNLKKEYLHAQEEVKRIQSVPLVIGQFLEAVGKYLCSGSNSSRSST